MWHLFRLGSSRSTTLQFPAIWTQSSVHFQAGCASQVSDKVSTSATLTGVSRQLPGLLVNEEPTDRAMGAAQRCARHPQSDFKSKQQENPRIARRCGRRPPSAEFGGLGNPVDDSWRRNIDGLFSNMRKPRCPQSSQQCIPVRSPKVFMYSLHNLSLGELLIDHWDEQNLSHIRGRLVDRTDHLRSRATTTASIKGAGAMKSNEAFASARCSRCGRHGHDNGGGTVNILGLRCSGNGSCWCNDNRSRRLARGLL